MFAGRLKELTSLAHSQVEQTQLLKSVFGKTPSRDAYVDILKSFYAIHSQLGDWRSELTLPYTPFDRCQRLLADLATLDECAAVRAPKAFRWDIPESWGMAYVVEGSNLGGQVLLSHFHRALGITPEEGGSYFGGYGQESADNWRAFQECLNQWGKFHPLLTPRAEEAALRTFARFQAGLSPEPTRNQP